MDITETQHVNHRVDHEKYCEAIYWKHHTSHHLTKISHTITFKTIFLTKIPFLLETSKIPYQNTVHDIFIIFYNSSHKNIITSSSSHLEYMQCVPDPTPKYPRNKEQAENTPLDEEHTNTYRTSSLFFISIKSITPPTPHH